MERINVHFADRQLRALELLSCRSGLKRSELIRRAIDEYIDRVSDSTKIDKECTGYTGVLGVTNG